MNLVSIITPLYNCKSSIKLTFESVLSQTFKDWEWIIVDDCSIDDSFSFAKELAKNEPRIIVLQTPMNSGSAAARNIGLKHSTGRYITFLDSDDLLEANYLEEQTKFIQENGPIITAGYKRAASKTTTNFIPRAEIDYKALLNGNDCSCLTTMYDKSIIGERYFAEDMKRCEDYVFWLNILKDGYIVKGNPQVLATYNIHEGSKSSKKFKLIKYMFKVYHKTQGINWFKSWFYVIRWAFYGKKKYKNVK